jgi:hypothetical protein
MNSLRFNPLPQWNSSSQGNRYFYGLLNVLFDLYHIFKDKNDLKMLEIGSYRGESTFMFASSGLFDEIHCIDPHEGKEEANDILKEDWESVKKDFELNTRYFTNITHHKDYSYNIVNKFPDKYFDFIYIDGSHEYEDVKRDIELYLPKTKHIIGGHDYQKEWPGVVQAVNETLGQPHNTYADESFIIDTRQIR